MRISDWSSDVCSSDLLAHIGGSGTQHSELGHGLFSILPDGTIVDGCGTSYAAPLAAKTAAVLDHAIEGEVSRETLIGLLVHHAEIPTTMQRSEEHPSELQSLLRISYTVLCLKTNTKKST